MLHIRIDSVSKKQQEKTRAQLQAENEKLKAQVADLQAQTDEQADALIELAGILSGEG